jgi:hypothetical protein
LHQQFLIAPAAGFAVEVAFAVVQIAYFNQQALWWQQAQPFVRPFNDRNAVTI